MWRKATFYKSATFAALVVASALATTSPASADLIFFVDQTITGASGTGTVTGTITFDGVFTGPQFTSDLVGFDLTTSVGGDTTTLMNGVNGASAFLGGGGLSITPDRTQLQFNFNGQGTFANFFSGSACAPVFSLRTSGGTLCNGVSGTVSTVQATNSGAIVTENMTGTGIQTIGTDTPPPPPPEIPLPPAIYLFGSVLGGAFWLGRRKRNAVSSLGSA